MRTPGPGPVASCKPERTASGRYRQLLWPPFRGSCSVSKEQSDELRPLRESTMMPEPLVQIPSRFNVLGILEKEKKKKPQVRKRQPLPTLHRQKGQPMFLTPDYPGQITKAQPPATLPGCQRCNAVTLIPLVCRARTGLPSW